MDPLTQGLLGGVTGQLGFRQRIGRDATWMAAGAAMAPDLDIFIPRLLRLAGAPIDDMTLHHVHRGVTHSLLMVPVLAGAATVLWWLLRRRWHRRHPDARRPSPWLLYACCFAAVLTHPLLDWCTSYGTQLLAPLTNRRFAADCVPIVDIFYTPILILTLLACLLVRKLGRRREARSRRATLVVGWVGFLLSVGYLATGRIMHDRAVDLARGITPRKARIVRADAYPVLGTAFLWRAVVETDRAWLVARVRPLGRNANLRRTWTPKQSDEWIDKALALPRARDFAWFAMGRIRADHETVDGRHVVHLHDMRYGLRTEAAKSLWSLRVEFDAAGNVVDVHRTRRHRPRDFGKLAGRLWRDIWTP